MTILILLWEAERAAKVPFSAKPLIQFASRLLSITDAIIVVVEVVIHDVVIFVRSLFYVPPHLAPTTHNWVAYAPFICLTRPSPWCKLCNYIIYMGYHIMAKIYIFVQSIWQQGDWGEPIYFNEICIFMPFFSSLSLLEPSKKAKKRSRNKCSRVEYEEEENSTSENYWTGVPINSPKKSRTVGIVEPRVIPRSKPQQQVQKPFLESNHHQHQW